MLHLCWIYCAIGTLLPLFLSNAAAQTLRPIRIAPQGGHSHGELTKRDMDVFDLRDYETFLWGAEGKPRVTDLSCVGSLTMQLEDGSEAVLGNLTVYTPGSDEHIISMEKFLPLTKAVTCDQSGISMVFRDSATFEKAKQVWDWANGAENRSFIMVAGAGDCGWNDHRQPFIVRTLDFKDTDNTARLNGEPASWQDVAHSYHLVA